MLRDLIEAGLNEGAGRVCTVVRLWGLFEITGPYRLAICQQRRGTLAHRRQFVARSASQAIAIDSLLRRPTVVALCGSTDSTPSVMIDAGSEMARDDCARHDPSERRCSRAGAAEAVSKALDYAHDATTIGTGRNLGPRLRFRIHGRRLAIVC